MTKTERSALEREENLLVEQIERLDDCDGLLLTLQEAFDGKGATRNPSAAQAAEQAREYIEAVKVALESRASDLSDLLSAPPGAKRGE